MSTITTETVAGDLTSTLLPTIARVDTRLDVSPVSVILVISIVFILSPITVTGNSIILAAFYRYKRLRTASNCLLVSLAISDFGVGVFMPFGIHIELSGLPESCVSMLCVAPYCIAIALCSVSVLVTVAIAVDRLTSLAQPLRYKNIITHSSIEKYIAGFWIYAIGVSFSPLIYTHLKGDTLNQSENCRFGAAIQPPVRVFLVMAVWAPSALVLLGCYMYVYWVARAHARAIYTVELSFRHQTQTLALPRYGQILAITVGAFFILWLPFQTCMLLDIFFNTNLLSEWTVIWLGLPILAHSAVNPWIYAFHHGELRIAAGKIAEDLVAIFGVTPSHYGCSPNRRESNTNLELADVNSFDGRRVPAEDCFASKRHSTIFASKKCLEMSKHIDISPESGNPRSLSDSCRPADIIEEDIHDLTKMLDPKYIIDRNHVIDSNHNIDKIKNLKYLLDPTFNKIRYLRRINHKRLNKNLSSFYEPRFISYQNLKSDLTGTNKKFHKMNTMSDPVLNADACTTEGPINPQFFCPNHEQCRRQNYNLSSLSDPNIKAATVTHLKLHSRSKNTCSVQNLQNRCSGSHNFGRMVQCRLHEYQKRIFPRTKSRVTVNKLESTSPILDFASFTSLPNPEIRSNRSSPMQRLSPHRHVNITPNKLMNFLHPDYAKLPNIHGPVRNQTIMLSRNDKESQVFASPVSVSVNESGQTANILASHRLMNSLLVPVVHSEPSSPIDPIPLSSTRERDIIDRFDEFNGIEFLANKTVRKNISPTRHSDPVIPSVLLNFEDYDNCTDNQSKRLCDGFNPEELTRALERRDSKLPETIFAEHDSTRYSSRRPSDSKWSESSRSQEILSTVTEYQRFPSSYSVNNFQKCSSNGSDKHDLTSCLDPFMCPNALSSSLHDSYFGALSAPDSDILMSFEETDEETAAPERADMSSSDTPKLQASISSLNLNQLKVAEIEVQSKSTESVANNSSIKLEPELQRNFLKMRSLNGNLWCTKPKPRHAPLASPTPTDICTPSFDIVTEIKGESGVGVRV